MTIRKESLKDRIFKGHTMRGMMKKAPLVVAFWLLSHGMDVNAADFTPSSTADSVNGTVVSLRDAVIAANGSTTVDRIVLGSGTYALSIAGRNEDQAATGDLDITRDVDSGELTIEGSGTTTTIIDGAGIDRVFHITNAGKVKFKNLTIKGGLATDDAGLGGKGIAPVSKDANGGGIANNRGVLTFENVSVEGNEARGGVGTNGLSGSQYGGYAQGGGIYTIGGSLTFTGGAVKNNQANAGNGLTNVTNPGGGGNAKGGGIYSDYSSPDAPIVGTGLEISGNSATGGVGGSAIAGYGGNTGGYSQGGGISSNEGSVTLTNSKINKNIARSGAGGKGGDGNNAFSDSNGGNGGSGGYGGGVQGGGLYVFFATLDMTGCEISDNQVVSGPAGDGGKGGNSPLSRGGNGGNGGSNYNSTQAGGIYVYSFKIQNAHANFTGCSIARNTVTGGVGGNGGAGGTGPGGNGVAGYGGKGGDVESAALLADFGTPLSIVNSTISKNSATAGNGGTGTSFSGASGGSVGYGGGVAAHTFGGIFELKNSTVVQNSSITGQPGTGGQAGFVNFGGGIYNDSGTTSVVISSIVAQNTANGAPADMRLSVDATSTNNLIGDSTAANGLTDPTNKTGTTASPLNPLLDVLKNNGGNTETHALLPGSPALESGVPNGLTFDQRGDGYPRTVGVTEIGAFENHAPTADAGGPYEINEGDPLSVDGSKSKGDAPLTYTWDINGDGTFGDATGVTPTLTAAQLTALNIVGGQTYAVKIKVSDGINAAVTADATLKVNIVQNSPPTVAPNEPTVGETVVVTTSGQPDSIDWGDGTVNTSSSHVYASPGTYTITVTTKTGSTKLTVVVSGLLKVIRLRGGLGVSGANTNLVRLTADIPDAASLKVAGAKITVDVGGAAANFILDGKGRVHQEFKDNGGSISKPKKNGTRRLFVSMLGDWLPNWADEKIQPSSTGRQDSTNILVKFTIDGVVYVSNVKIWLSPRPNAVRLFDSNIKRPGG